MHPEARRQAQRLMLGVLAGFATIATADEPSARYCEVAMEFSLNGKTVAAPTAIVEFGKEAEVTIGNPDEHAWQFRIFVDEPTIVRRANVIPVSVELYEIGEGKPYLRASPHIKAVPGQRADIDTIFADGDGRRAHIALVANPRSGAEVEALRNAAGDAEMQ